MYCFSENTYHIFMYSKCYVYNNCEVNMKHHVQSNCQPTAIKTLFGMQISDAFLAKVLTFLFTHLLLQ